MGISPTSAQKAAFFSVDDNGPCVKIQITEQDGKIRITVPRIFDSFSCRAASLRLARSALHLPKKQRLSAGPGPSLPPTCPTARAGVFRLSTNFTFFHVRADFVENMPCFHGFCRSHTQLLKGTAGGSRILRRHNLPVHRFHIFPLGAGFCGKSAVTARIRAEIPEIAGGGPPADIAILPISRLPHRRFPPVHQFHIFPPGAGIWWKTRSSQAPAAAGPGRSSRKSQAGAGRARLRGGHRTEPARYPIPARPKRRPELPRGPAPIPRAGWRIRRCPAKAAGLPGPVCTKYSV